MTQTLTIDVPVNRVEGDLEVRVQMDGGVVSDAWSSGTMYRGFEKIMVGRGALDGLVITPRICGLCSTAHLTAAARALDALTGATPPPDALRMRNVALMTEFIQSDMRHGFLMFMVDFANPAYRESPLFQESVRRYEAFKGETAQQVMEETRRVLEIVAVIGGQWPHSSYMVPGGIVSVPSTADILHCRHGLARFRSWYERRVLGCPLERWLAVGSRAELEAWLEESPAHWSGEVGFFIRLARRLGLDTLGRGHGNFLSYGAFDLPDDTEVRGRTETGTLIAGGFARGLEVHPFDQGQVAEQVSHSWFEDCAGGKHPFDGRTEPYASGREGQKYSWSKAPRYAGVPAETGPLAEMIVNRNPLFLDLVAHEGPSVFVRELARLARSAELLPAMHTWLSEVTGDGRFYTRPEGIPDGQACGLTEATRGALGHWVKVKNGRIAHYQIITPTAWNASPRDDDGVRGPWEEALVGTAVKDSANPVELGHVVRSFDACLVCTVH